VVGGTLRPAAPPFQLTLCKPFPFGPPLGATTHRRAFPPHTQTKDGKPRFYKLDSLIHYGALPQTYEDPAHADSRTGLLGDGDPIDVCDIAVGAPARVGSVYRVKVLGALALIDGGETDWKILAVRADDPAAAGVSDIATAPASVRRIAEDVREWFRNYKIPEGKGANSFAFDGRWLPRDDALAIIADTHEQWRRLLARPRAPAGAKGPWVPQWPLHSGAGQ
jgi:inorganic pyrophosphatase